MFIKQKLLIFVLTVAGLGWGCLAMAQDPIPSATPQPNSILSERADEVVKRAMLVMKEEDGVITLSLPPAGHSFVNKTQILFFRRRRTRMEVISRGVVTGEKRNSKGETELLVDVDRDSIVKYPQTGDFAIPMSDADGTNEGDKKEEYNYLLPEKKEKKEEDDRPGYLEFGAGLMQGSMNSTPNFPQGAVPGNPDQDKNPTGYRFMDLHAAYYLDFFPIGFEYDHHGGNFPTQTRDLLKVNSSESVTTMNLGYRLHPFFNKHLYTTVKFSMLSDTFKTDNPDENLLNTKMSGTGGGLRFAWDFVPVNWKPQKSRLAAVLQDVYIEGIYYFSVNVQDQSISRGTSSSGSNALAYRMGADALAYIPFIPLFKRWVFNVNYGGRAYNLKFQGPTVSQSGSIYQLPQGGASKLTENDVRFFVGIRIDDPIRMLFAPKSDDKKGDSK